MPQCRYFIQWVQDLEFICPMPVTTLSIITASGKFKNIKYVSELCKHFCWVYVAFAMDNVALGQVFL
jgi:hypothetical protein